MEEDLSTLDLSFFADKAVEQIRLGVHQAQLVFDGDVSIDVECDFTFDGTKHSVGETHVLHVLLGLNVQRAHGVRGHDLAIDFAEHELILHKSNDMYESYAIHIGREMVVV